MRCPSFERLLDYLDGKLAASESSSVQAHLASDCVSCAASRQWYQQVRAVAAADDTVEPPAWVLKRALRIFDQQRPRLGERSTVERMKDAVAALVFDSFARPAVAGVRSTETSNRQLLYRAGDYHLDLQIAPAGPSRPDLIGQVLREGDATFASVAEMPLALLRGEQAKYEITTNEMGEFVIRGVEEGEYNVRLETSEGSVTAYAVPVIIAD
jgi:hypothetical protein